ncbi:MAG: ornithine aminomutase subunit alpha [Deltaproteobacteria bacterium]|nr:ornithine aminomutase subunit alpha [Candidatus Zymogenaceae bacterium]
MERADDFEKRRAHLADMSDERLKDYFWELVNTIIQPLVEEAKGHTSPSIERSVLLRMGFSSLEAKALVTMITDRGLLGSGAGRVVYRAAEAADVDVRTAGLKLLDGGLWDEVTS